MKLSEKLKSRKFLTAIFGAFSYFILEMWGIKIPDEVLYLLLTWIGVEGAVDLSKEIGNKRVERQPRSVAPLDSTLKAEPMAETTTQEKPTVEVPIPFDKQAFETEIDKNVVSVYGTENPCTRFYYARDYLFKRWYFNNSEAYREAADHLLRLAHRAFEFVWGMSYEEALRYEPKRGECIPKDIASWARQRGTEYYVALLDLQRIMAWHAQATSTQ